MGGKTVWVGGLPHPATPEEIEEHFGQFGRVVHIEWPMRWDKKLGVDRHKGYCKLTFAEKSSCEAAVIQKEFYMKNYPDKNMAVEMVKSRKRTGSSWADRDQKKGPSDAWNTRMSTEKVQESSQESRFFPRSRGTSSASRFTSVTRDNNAKNLLRDAAPNTSSRWNWPAKPRQTQLHRQIVT